ncbi:DegT/DnrJ/EryC1/StrS family aminotransferase [Devosia sp.]|uniref:DegT/DnrJ/EryC1/StrS family aminotransferase n=1 Tax=Devosia sp. TaxID=1871048 RepID=UPI0032674229
MNIYESLGVRTIINAKGTATRLSGGRMRPEIGEAMLAASQLCVDIAELQAAASLQIAAATGAEAGYVASGASACLLLAAAACMAGLNPGRMARLPDTGGMNSQVIMVRSQRNGYDHAIRASGASLIEVGLPDRFAGAGVRDAQSWEIEDAITGQTAAIFYVADEQAQPPLAAVTEIARRHGVPVIVDAAAQLPPASNLRRFIAEGADLVAFSGGKVLGGPQASGFLCGRRDLIMSVALQHLDLDVYEDMWAPPPSLIDRSQLVGMPPHGIGRSCKAGKEEIVGLLVALKLFQSETDAGRHAAWLARLQPIEAAVRDNDRVKTSIEHAGDTSKIPLLTVTLGDGDIRQLIGDLIHLTPSIHVDAGRRDANMLAINPVCFWDEDIPAIIGGLHNQLR